MNGQKSRVPASRKVDRPRRKSSFVKEDVMVTATRLGKLLISALMLASITAGTVFPQGAHASGPPRQYCLDPVRNAYLDLYWSPGRGDNFSTAVDSRKADASAYGYYAVESQGYIYRYQSPGLVPLKLFYSSAREDNFTTATAQGERAALGAGYQFVDVEGWVWPTYVSSFVPLKLFYNEARQDNFTTASPQEERVALAAGYQFVDVEAYVRLSCEPT